MTNEESGLSLIFNGDSPFKDGQVETLAGFPEGGAIPSLPDAPQEFAPGLYTELKSKLRILLLLGRKGIWIVEIKENEILEFGF
ncbi:MAG TPA: hypothetical protein VK250_08175 [Nitrososphaeraceae archaeon]|nr:hypothetical protein [Nitrososphaeraceae archaeon]